MMTSSKGNIFRVTGSLCGKFTGQRWIPLTKASEAGLWYFLCSTPWINSRVNNREAGDSRRHRAHYDVIVMGYSFHRILHNIWTTGLQWVRFMNLLIFYVISDVGPVYQHPQPVSFGTDLHSFIPLRTELFWHNNLLRWKGGPDNNKETNGLPTSWPLSNVVCLMAVILYLYHSVWVTWL